MGNVCEPSEALPATHRALLMQANVHIAENVAAVGGKLADIHRAFLGNEDAYLTEVVEPNLAGAARIAELFRDASSAHA